MAPREMAGPSEKDMGIKKSRPTEADFVQKMAGYLVPLQGGIYGQYDGMKFELEQMAAGRGDSEVREEFYPGWENEDFQEVLKRLGVEEEKIGYVLR